MPIELKSLPSLIAIPYSETLKKDSIQRKDFQRLVLENALTLNAIVAISDFYNHNRKRTEETDKKYQILPNVPNIDLGQISVGTWNMFSREFTRVLKTDQKNAFNTNIIDMYHGSTAKEWENVAGSLITIRNKDAHGELIAADKLTAELDKRQEIIDKLVNILSFYNDYILIVPYDSEVIEGKFTYLCKEFNGLTESTISISESKDDMEFYRVYLYNKKNSTALCLNPMIVANPTSKENSDTKLFLYSKTANKKLGNLHYLAIDSSRDFVFDDNQIQGKFFSPSLICEEFQAFRIVVEDPSLHDQKKPELSILRTLKTDFISKNDLLEMTLKIKNSGEAIAENMEIKFNYAANHFAFCNKDGDDITGNNVLNDIFGDELNLESGQNLDYTFYFKPKDSGQYEFPSFTIEYEYTDYLGNPVKPKIDKEGVATNIEQVPALYCTVFDPGDPFSLAPVINVKIDIDFGKDDKGADRIYAYIGETIPLTVTLKNQGLGVAKNVDFSVFLPKGVEITGSSKHWNGNINPLQTITKTYDLTLKEPGIHSINIREIIYFNNDNESFKTTGGSYSLLVRNKPEVQYRQLMQQVWADLNLDDDEKEELGYFLRKFGKLITPESMLNIEIDEKIKIIKSAISAIAVSKGFKLLEKIASGDRILFAYNSFECPILVLDFADKKNLKIYLRADLQGKYPIEIITIKGVVRSIPMNKIGFDEPIEGNAQSLTGGINMLKGLLGRAIGWIEKHDWLQLQLRTFFAKALSISIDQLSAKLFTRQFYYKIESENKNNDYLIKEFATYFDSKNNLHLVAKVDADITTRKKLVEKGYKYMGAQPKESEIAYSDSTNATTFLYVGTQKINNDDDKEKYAKKLIQMLLTALEEQNYLLEDVLKKKGIEPEQVTAIMQTHNTLLQVYEQEKATLGLTGLIFKLNYEDKGKNYNLDITYYAIKELPLYQEKQKFLAIKCNKKEILLNFRNISEEIIERDIEKIKISKDFYPYTINTEILQEVSSDFLEILKFALTKSNVEKTLPNYYFLKYFIDNNIVNNFGWLCKAINENNGSISSDEIKEYYKANDINSGLGGQWANLNVSFQKIGVEVPITFESKEKLYTFKAGNDSIMQKLLSDFQGRSMKEEEFQAWNLKKLFNSTLIDNEYLAVKPDTTSWFTLVLRNTPFYKTHKDYTGLEIRAIKNILNFQYRVSKFDYTIDLYDYYKEKSLQLQENPIIDNLKIKFLFDDTKDYAQKAIWRVGPQLSIEYPFAYQTDIFDIEKIKQMIIDLNKINQFLFPEELFEAHFKLNESISEDDNVIKEILTFRNPESYNDLLAWREQNFGFKFQQ